MHDETSANEKVAGAEKPYKVVYSALRRDIVEKRVPAGLVLLEGAVADFFGISRTPAQKALQMLEADGIIQRFDGRGYIVTEGHEAPVPVKLELASSGLTMDSNVEAAIQSRAGWERLYNDVESATVEAMAFGKFRVIEAEMAAFYGVSRTVVRDVLGRLHEAGLVDKDDRSHWTVGPLTAQSLSEYYEMRVILESAALAQTGPKLDETKVVDMLGRVTQALARYPDVGLSELDRIEQDLHVACVATCENARLLETLRRNRLPLTTNRMFHQHLGLPPQNRDLIEHKRVLELLADKSVEAARSVLEDHLRRARDRAKIRLKLLALSPLPKLKSYFRPVT